MEWEAARALTMVRAHQMCEGCGRTFVDDVHHRRPRGMGGVFRAGADAAHSATNLLALCRPCHDWAESERDAAESLGWIVRHHRISPAAFPAQLHTIYGWAWYFLDPEFGYVSCDEWQLRRIARASGVAFVWHTPPRLYARG